MKDIRDLNKLDFEKKQMFGFFKNRINMCAHCLPSPYITV